jgi:ribonuclease P protein component
VRARSGRFQQADRLRRPAEFQRVMRRGRRVAGRAFVVVALERDAAAGACSASRLGVTVSRKVGRAVVRNRVKRRIREWFRVNRCSLGGAVDLVVIGRPPAAELTSEGARDELSRLGRSAVRGRPPGDAA